MRNLLVFGALAFSCASVNTNLHPAPAGVERYGNSIDWSKAGEEAAEVVSKYLQVDTINPPGNETRGAEHLAALLKSEGIESEIHEFAPGRGSLIARLPASGPVTDKPLCLMSHIDVVPAEASQWPAAFQPLSGATDENGYIWGRGALDMKSTGALEALALMWLKRSKVPLNREVILLAVADEEVDNQGMRLLLDKHWDKLNCGQLVNEGGMGIKNLLTEGQTAFAITVAERGTLWLRMTATGEAGHGSTPVPNRAPTRLIEAMKALGNRLVQPEINPALYELLRRAGEAKGGFTGFVLQRKLLVDAFVKPKLMAKASARAAITDTCQVTGFEGRGSAANVIPSKVSALIDCRVLPGHKPEALLGYLKELTAGVEGIEFEVLNIDEATTSTWDDSFFEALARHSIEGIPGAVAGPGISPGYTDSLLVRAKGTKAYGVAPFEVTQEELATMHGRNERVSKVNLKRGLEALFRAVVDVSTPAMTTSN